MALFECVDNASLAIFMTEHFRSLLFGKWDISAEGQTLQEKVLGNR